MIPRIQAFEFCDQPWLPAAMREGFMDCLDQIHRLWQPYRHIAPLVASWVRQLGVEEVVDLGSGGGGQVATVLEHMEQQGLDAPRFILSDLYPNVPAWRALQRRFGPERIGFIPEPVSINAIPKGYRALSIFSAFHHFPPVTARRLLSEVSAHRDGLLVVEFTRRTWGDVLSMLPAFFLNLAAPIFAEHFRWNKLLLSPVIAAMVSFDGVISSLRSYTLDEIKDLLPPGSERGFTIEYGEVAWGKLPFSKSSYFLLSRLREGNRDVLDGLY